MKYGKQLINYNRRDCEITYKIVLTLYDIYIQEGSKKVKSTTGSQAMNIFLRRFFCQNFYKIPLKVLSIWRKCYSGGLVKCYLKGLFKGMFYKIDINSLYPFIMRMSLPYPYEYIKVNSLSKKYSYSKYLLVLKKNNKATGLVKEIYKKLLNSLYGKFGQRFELDVVSNYAFRKMTWYYEEQIKGDLYRRKYIRTKGKFWVNVVWSLFITAKARKYMRNLKRYVVRRGLKVYYLDTDCFIVSGNIKNIANIIDKDKLGLFKIEGTARIIDIRGKKFYRFGKGYKCKGVPAKFRKRFFNDGKVKFNKMVKYKEGLTRGLRIGSWVATKKVNRSNLPIDK